jgi:hypothetical protein
MSTPTSTELTILTPKYLQVASATSYSGLSRAKLYELMAEGQIRSISVRQKGRIRGRRLISVESLDAFLKSFEDAE